MNQAVREELTARYARCTAVVAEELRPGLELLQQEMAALGQPLVALQRQLTRLYRRHPALRSVGSAVSQRYVALMCVHCFVSINHCLSVCTAVTPPCALWALLSQ